MNKIKSNLLGDVRQDLIKEWHPFKNGDKKPNNFSYGSKEKVWWKCKNDHEWNAIINSRTTKNSGCPYCTGKKASIKNNLKLLFPKIAKEWHRTKNIKLSPNEVTPKSNKRVWWQCKNGHEWEAKISNRTKNKNGCRFCLSVHFLFSNISSEWDIKKNNNLNPKDFTYGSHKTIWWKCSKGHEWESKICDRTLHKSDCPYCVGTLASSVNNLKVLHPDIAKEWHPSKNNKNKPVDFTPGSNEKVWWLCKNNHEIRESIKNRVNKNTGCQRCLGFDFIFPNISKEWHPEKNGNYKPNDFTYGSGKSIWWKCLKGHEWRAKISDRTLKHSNCPSCSNQSSRPEIRILSELEFIFHDIKSRYKIDGKEIDIFLPSCNIWDRIR